MTRESTFTDEVAEEICNQIAEGVPLRQICRQDKMPSWRTVYRWLEEQPEFSARFARARDIGADAIAEEALEIADTPVEGVETTTDKNGASEKRGDMLGHRKLQVETRLKLLAKWNPKKYGNKVDLTSSDGSMSPRTMADFYGDPQSGAS